MKRFLLLVFVFIPSFAWALTPIAHTDVVPYQRIEYGTSFNFGVVAFSKAGIDRVDFVISGQGYESGTKSSDTMALNTRVASGQNGDPGADYEGVYEYYVSIPASEFTTNGTITVTPTVYGDDAGEKALSAVTLYVEGASDESPTEAWVDSSYGGGDSEINNSEKPFTTIAAAISAIQTADGESSYATIYLAEDTYNSGITGTTTTDSTGWLTITRESGANIDNVIIDEDGTSWDTDHIKMYGVTLRSTGANDKALNQAGAWVDQCKLFGTVYGEGVSFPNPYSGSGYITSSYIHHVNFALESTMIIARGLDIKEIYDDLAQGQVFVVNCHLDGMYGEYDSIRHSDVMQFFGSGSPDNNIFYNIYATNCNYQSFQFYNTEDVSNRAIVNVFIETRSDEPGGGGKCRFYGFFDHLLLWHVTIASAVEDVEDICEVDMNAADYAGYTGFGYENTSIIGCYFERFNINESYGGDQLFLNSGNSYNNTANYNHYERSGYDNPGENTSTGDGVIDLTTPGSATYGAPVSESSLIDALPSNLTGVLCDALGNLRDATPDKGAIEIQGEESSSPPTISGCVFK